MNKAKKFVAYLEALKNAKNSSLLEGIINGFNTLMEYKIDGTITERQVDIMENVDDIDETDAPELGDLDIPLDESTSGVMGKIHGKNSDAYRHAKYLEDQKKQIQAGIKSAGEKNRASFSALNENEGTAEDLISQFRSNPYMLTPDVLKTILDSGLILKLLGYPSKTEEDDMGWDEELDHSIDLLEDQANDNIEKVPISANDLYNAGLDQSQISSVFSMIRGVPVNFDAPDSIMEVGEGEIKGKLTPQLLQQIDMDIMKKISQMAKMIDSQKLVRNSDEKQKYLDNMRGQLWRDALLDKGVDPSVMRGLIPSMNESIDEANKSLLESVSILKMLIDRSK